MEIIVFIDIARTKYAFLFLFIFWSEELSNINMSLEFYFMPSRKLTELSVLKSTGTKTIVETNYQINLNN